MRPRGLSLFLLAVTAVTPVAEAAAQTQSVQSSRRRANRTTERFAEIASEWQRCRDAAQLPAHLLPCDTDAVISANALARRSHGNALLIELLPDMFAPILAARAGGGDPLGERAVISAAFAEFAQQRARILNRATPGATTGPRASRASLLGRIDAGDPGGFERRWTAIREQDCLAYPVQNCAAQLDAAFGRMIEDLLPGA